MNGQPQKSGASQKPPEPRCPMCGSPMAKSPLGQTALRGVESIAKQMHQAKLRPGATTARPRQY